MPDNIIEEYLVSIKPSVDMKAWDELSGKIQQRLGDAVKGAFTGRNNLNLLGQQIAAVQEKIKGGDNSQQTADDLKQLQASYSKLNKEVTANEYRLQKAGFLLSLFAETVEYAKSKAKEFADEAANISNQLVNQSSLFVDTNTRDIMGKYGVDSLQAKTINDVTKSLDYSLDGYARWTQGQKDAFSSLMKSYQAELNNIDPEKLEEFNRATQQYQLQTVEFELKMQAIKTKLYANSEALPKLLDFLSEKMEQITDLMSTEAFQTAFDVFIGIIEGILQFATMPLNFLSSVFGGGDKTTKNTTNNNNSKQVTFNMYNEVGTDSSSLAMDIGLQVQNAMTRL